MNEFYSTSEAMEVLGFNSKARFWQSGIAKAAIRFRGLYQKKTIDDLADQLIDSSDVPAGMVTIGVLAKEYPCLTSACKTHKAKISALLRKVPKLKQIRVLMRQKNCIQSIFYYPENEARAICDEVVTGYNRDGFLTSAEVKRLFSAVIPTDISNSYWNERFLNLCKKHDIEVFRFRKNLLKRKGANWLYSKTDIMDLLNECICDM